MVHKNEVMVGDIIRLKKWAAEVLEISNNSATLRILNVGVGKFTEAWAKLQPYALDPELEPELLETIGFKRVEGSNNFWVYDGDDYTAHYHTTEHSLTVLSVLSNPLKPHGEGYFYIYSLHELMQIFRRLNFETCDFYKRMRDYVPPLVI